MTQTLDPATNATMPPDATYKRRRQLHSIELAMSACDPRKIPVAVPGPATLYSIGVWYGVVGLILGVCSVFELKHIGWGHAILVATLVAATYRLQSKQPRSWRDHLAQRLANYEPANKLAYQDLKQKLLALGNFDHKALDHWLHLEKASLDHAASQLPTQWSNEHQIAESVHSPNSSFGESTMITYKDFAAIRGVAADEVVKSATHAMNQWLETNHVHAINVETLWVSTQFATRLEKGLRLWYETDK